MKVRYEPAVVWGALQALVVAVVTLVVAFGVQLSADQQAAIVGAVAALGAVVSSLVVRSQVTPVAKLEDHGVHVPGALPPAP